MVGAVFLFLLASQLRGDWIYFHAWEKANPKAVMQYVNSHSDPGMAIVRPAYFSAHYSYYDQTGARVMDQDKMDSAGKRSSLHGKKVLLVAFDVPSDPVTDAFLSEFHETASRHFPGFARLGITVYALESKSPSRK